MSRVCLAISFGPFPLAEGFLAFFGPAPGGPVHAGGACDSRQRSPEVVVFMHEPVLTRDHEIQPFAGGRTAYGRSRFPGVGAGIVRRRRALASIRHGSRDRSISLMLFTNPSQFPGPTNPVFPTNLPHASAHFTLALV